MAAEITDPFATQSGLPDNFEGVVTRAYFGTDATFREGEDLALIIEVEHNEEDFDSPQRLMFGTGKNWEPDTEPFGTSITRTTGRPAFHENSAVALLYTSMFNAGLKSDKALEHGLPTEASMYVGWRFQWKRLEKDYGGEIGKRARLLPAKYLGEVKVEVAAKKTRGAAAAAPKAAAAVVAAAADTDELVLDRKTRTALINLAGDHDSFEAFVAAATAADHDTELVMKFGPAIFEQAGG